MKKLLLILTLLPSILFAQNYADKSYYLIDSLELNALSKGDRILLDSCLDNYHTAKDDTSRINALNGICENMVHDYWSKYQFFQFQLIEAALKKGDSKKTSTKLVLLKALAGALNNIGCIYDSKGDITKALEYYQKSLKISEDINDKITIASSINNIGYAYDNQGDINRALEYFKKSLKILEELDNNEEMASILNNIGSIYDDQGDILRALEYYHKSLKIRKEIGDKKGIASSLNNIGYAYDSQGNILKALEYYHKSLKIWEEIGDKEGTANSFNNIGYIYDNQGDLSSALIYYNKSLKIREKTGYKKGIALSLNNIGLIYFKQGNISKALDYYSKSLKLREEIGVKSGVANSLNNIGEVYISKGNYTKAREFLTKSLEIREEINEKNEIINSLNNIAKLEMKIGNLEKAKVIYERSLKISQEIGFPQPISLTSYKLNLIFQKQGDFKKALEMYKLHILMRDSINNEETQKAAIRQQTKYEYEKKAAADSIAHIKLQELKQAKIEKQQTEIIYQQNQKYGLFVGIALVLLFSGFIFNRFKVTQKQKVIIEEKTNEIQASISYAERIQQAVLPEIKLHTLFENSFLIYKPKDIVSGDFYWWEKEGDHIYIAVADCTGHGVPGGFMSMLGTIFLNEIFNSKKIYNPSLILDELSRLLRITLKDKYGHTIKDGMDISFACVNTKTCEVQWSGAYNPIYILRKDKKVIEQIKADKMPIGFSETNKPFTNHEIKLEKGDTIYLFSDGYADQFGGPKGKKFSYKQLRNLFVEISNKSMEEQKQVLDTTFDNWIVQGNEEQIDDVCVIGVKL